MTLHCFLISSQAKLYHYFRWLQSIYKIYGSIFTCVFTLALYHIENDSLGFLEYHSTQLREAREKHPVLHTFI